MRRPNTDSTKNKPVTLPRNQLLETLRGHESRPHCHDTVLRYAVTLQVCTHPYMTLCFVGSVVPVVSKDLSTFALKGQGEEETSGTADPPARRHMCRAMLRQVKKLRRGTETSQLPPSLPADYNTHSRLAVCSVYQLHTAVCSLYQLQTAVCSVYQLQTALCSVYQLQTAVCSVYQL